MSSPETMKDKARFYISDRLLEYKVFEDLSLADTEDLQNIMASFAEKESLDRAIEELEKIISDGATHYRRAWIEQRIAELKAAQKGDNG